jgi:hypothetical protein
MKNIKINSLTTSTLTFVAIIFSFSILNLIYFTIFYNKFGYLPNPFIFDKNNTFMDFYNPLYWAFNKTQYTLYNSIYPPINFIILDSFCLLFSCSNASDSFIFRDLNKNFNLILIICFYGSLFISFYSIRSSLLGLRKLEIIILFLAISISPPVLFALERGNLIFLVLPLICIALKIRNKLSKLIIFGLIINIKPYLLILLLHEFNIFKYKIKLILYLILSVLFIFLISSYFYDINYLNYFMGYFIFANKFPAPATDILSLPFSLSSLTTLRKLSANFHHYSVILFLPLIINTVTILVLTAATLTKKLTSDEFILSSFLITVNFTSLLGGYAYLLYIPFLPFFFKVGNTKKYLVILSCIFFLPIDFIRIVNLHEMYIDSYIGQVLIGQINQYLTLGSFLRPILNYSILAIFTLSICKKYEFNTNFFGKFRFLRRISASLSNTRNINSIALALTLVSIFSYNYLFSFSYLPITEGWFLAYAKLIANGAMPYKDFYLYLTPVYPLLITFFISIFGDSLYAQRILGIFVILAISTIVFLLLNRKFSAQSSFAGTVVAIIYYQSGVAHITYDFTQILTLTIVTTIFFIANTYRSSITPCNEVNWFHSLTTNLYLSACFASISFFIKQSNGTFIVIFAALTILFILFITKSINTRNVLIVIAGFLSPVLVIFIWLSCNDSIGLFWDQIFTGAISAKGSLSPIAFAWFFRLFSADLIFKIFKIFAMTLILAIIYKTLVHKKIIQLRDSYLSGLNLKTLLVFFITIISSIFISFQSPSAHVILNFANFGSKVSSYVLPVCIFYIFVFFASRKNYLFKPSKEDSVLVVMVMMSLGMIWGNGTSAGVGEIAVFLLLGIIVAQLLEIQGLSTFFRIATIAISTSFITSLCIAKFNTPYYWWGLKQPNVREASSPVDANIGSKFKISKESANILEALDKAIPKKSEGDIFAFPNIPIVYLISNRWPQSKVLVQWFDFLPDNIAFQEAGRLLQKPPETIVNLILPNNVWDSHEFLFRGGKKSGQRLIQNAITTLTRDGDLYKMTFSEEISDGYSIEIWQLKNVR